MKTIVDLMRADAVSLLSKKGGRRRRLLLTGILGLLFVLLGVFVMPDFLAYLMVLLSLLIVPTVIGQETRSGSERLLCLLPTSRRDIVYARFLMTCGSYTAVCLVLYLLMLLSVLTGFAGGSVTVLIFEEMISAFGIPYSPMGLLNMLSSVCYVIGLAVITGQMRGYFRHGDLSGKNSLIRKVLRVVLFYAAFLACGTALLLLCTLPLCKTLLSLLLTLVFLLASPLHGLLLCLTLLVIGAGLVIYQVVCSVIEYDAREL